VSQKTKTKNKHNKISRKGKEGWHRCYLPSTKGGRTNSYHVTTPQYSPSTKILRSSDLSTDMKNLRTLKLCGDFASLRFRRAGKQGILKRKKCQKSTIVFNLVVRRA
jgi:hypothetical protein